ncbi:hypothetical protein PQ459_15330 [Chryseobacterium sp. KACC 21268]|nr:hypothetical protein PQ459_15330 [Chryseobacterium sp. KACC 21268]
MKKRFYFFGLVLLATVTRAQVGINTTDPKSTLDINGNMTIRTIANVENVTSDHTILLRDTSPNGDSEIKEINSDRLFHGSTAYYATKNGNWSLLNLSIGGNWQKLNITGSTDTKLGNPALFTDGVYTAQKSGIYVISYEFQLEAGVNLEALGGKKLGILKNNEIWEEKSFDGVRVSLLGITLASVPITSSGIQSIVSLNTGDTLTFAVDLNGLLNLGLLTNTKVNLYVYRITS